MPHYGRYDSTQTKKSREKKKEQKRNLVKEI